MRLSALRKLAAPFGVLLLTSPAAIAQEEVPPALDSGDTAWMLTATVLVLFMTLPGLALFYGGLVRAKNYLSVLMHCFAVACLASVLWVAGLYSLAFSEGSAFIGDLKHLFLKGIGRGELNGNSFPETVFVMFQMTFAIITPGLIIGAFVERIKFGAVLLFTALWLCIVYVPIAHMVWGGTGWMLNGGILGNGVLDLAGGIIKNKLGIDDALDVFAVHGVGGMMGSTLVAVLGVDALGGFGITNPGSQLLTQVIAVAVTALWSALGTVGIVYIVKATVGLRTRPEQEEEGLDQSEHGENAYSFD